MYHYSSYSSFLFIVCFVVLVCCLGSVDSQQCVVNNTITATSFNYTYSQPLTALKANATRRLKIGVLGNFPAMDIITMNAIIYELNNQNETLPDVAIDLYSTTTFSSSDVLESTLFHINQLKVQGLIAGLTASEARNAQLAAKIYTTPHMSHMASGYILSDKNEYPYFLRTMVNDIVTMDTIVALMTKFNWTKGIIVYTPDDFGTQGYQRLTTLAANHNITFYAVSVPSLASKVTDVNATIDDITATMEQRSTRIFVYYTQFGPGMAVRQALFNKGITGKDIVSILTVPVAGPLIGPMNSTLNDGAIGMTILPPSGPIFNQVYQGWRNSKTNPFPLQRVVITSWLGVDCVLSYAYAFDQLMKNGTAFSAIKGNLLLKKLLSLNFTGTSGRVFFDPVGDRLGDLHLFSLFPDGPVPVAYYSSSRKELVQTGTFLFGGRTTTVPRDGPYVCLQCTNGKCVENVGCVCNSGWQGKYCDSKIKSRTAEIAGIAAAAVIMVGALFVGFLVYRRQRRALVKQVAEKQRSNISRADLNLQVRIGRGASGEVFKGTFRGTEVAVKRIVAASVTQKVIEEFELEVAIMCGLRHPNIILFMGSCYDASSKEMLLVMEYMAKGSLHDVLHNQKVALNYDMKLHLALQAAQGVNFLHQSVPPIIHRDLKSHNILLDDKWNARISDFGITKLKGEEKGSTKGPHNSIGTIYWSAPETLNGEEATEKSDVYSFGIILWEIFHRENPYQGRDPVSVAIEVINSNLRPPVSNDVPGDMIELIRTCWDKNQDARPTFQDIVTNLRTISMKNPSYMMSGSGRTEAPSGNVYLVNSCVQNAFNLWENKPKEMCQAMELHNGLLRNNMEVYRGYECKYEYHSFLVAFENAEDAINFCVATQIALLHMPWPNALLSESACAREYASNGELIWSGLRVQMAVNSGTSNCDHDPITDRMVYMGAVVDKVGKMLRGMKRGSIIVSDSIVDEINKKRIKFIEPVTTKKCGEMSDSARNKQTALHQVVITTLEERSNTTLGEGADIPHSVVEIVEDVDHQPLVSARGEIHSARGPYWQANSNPNDVNWLVHYAEFDMKETLGKGSMGDYQRASWRGKDVAVKTLINQKLKEGDMLRLLSDSAMMSKLSHPNLVQFYAVCLDHNHLATVSENAPHGNLRAALSDSSNTTLTLPKRMKIAHEIACGMSYLTNLADSDMKKHDNLKSHNILLGKDWDAKIGDYGQSNLKELARTMTSVGSVAWTAPELLTGEMESTPKIATYSFGIILWELYTRQIPYESEHPIRVVSKILLGFRPAIPANCPPVLSQLITDCVKANPNDRPPWDSIISSLSAVMSSI